MDVDGTRDERPTKGERREEKRNNARKQAPTQGRSVFLLMELGRSPKGKHKQRRTRHDGS